MPHRYTSVAVAHRTPRPSGFWSLALLALVAATPAIAAIPAGTPIANTATLTFDSDGAPQRLASNTVTLVSAELLDVTIVAERPSIAI